MKYALVVMCWLAIIYTGGCTVTALVFTSLAPLLAIVALVAAAIFWLNILVLGGLFGWKWQWQPAFYALPVLDFLLAGAVIYLMYTSFDLGLGGRQNVPSTDNTLGLGFGFAIAGALILKAALTLYYARHTQRSANALPPQA